MLQNPHLVAGALRGLAAAAGLLTTVALPAQAQNAADSSRTTPPSMLKLGLNLAHTWDSRLGFTVPFYLGAERQLGQHWSLTADTRADVGFGYLVRPSGVQLAKLGLAVGARYYYNQERRARKGRPLRSLTGNYLHLQYTGTFAGDVLEPGYGGRVLYFYQPGAELTWGLQRRFGKHGFVDAGVGLHLQKQPWSDRGADYHIGNGWYLEPQLRLRTGFAF